MKRILLFIGLCSSLNSNAQDYIITFAGTGASANITTVKVENLTSGRSLYLSGSDILHLIAITTGINPANDDQLSKIRIYPNPMTDFSTVQIYPPLAGKAVITVHDITGKPVGMIQSYLEKSGTNLKISGLKNGFYLINVAGNNYHFSGKLLSNGRTNGTINIEKVNSIIQTANNKVQKSASKGGQSTVDMEYSVGDRLKFTGISGNYSTIKMDIPTQSKTILFNFIECTDGDNINYPVVEIGNQAWMAENLRTTKYSNTSPVPLVKDNPAWQVLTTHGYSWYNNDKATYQAYGALYNWYVVDAANNGGKYVCPTGWHVPSDAEWAILVSYLGGSDVSGAKLKETGLNNWRSPNTGTNESGFTATGVGDRNITGAFEINGQDGTWWTSDSYDNINGWFRSVSHDQFAVKRNYYNKANGFSVRCLKGGMPVLSASAVTSVTKTTAIAGGNIINVGPSASTARGVCWSTSPNPTIENKKTINGSGTGKFISSIAGLTANTTYYLRAYNTNSSGTYYSNELIFKTYTGTVMDFEGNKYYTVTIGNQEWMAENLRTTRYRGGDTIGGHTFGLYPGHVPPDHNWVIGDDEGNAVKYGRLYNWVASKDSICPIGWRLPGYTDWRKLTNGADSTYERGGYMETFIKFPGAKSLAATTDWLPGDLDGNVGKNMEYNNITGFTGLPGASWFYTYGNIGKYGSWFIDYKLSTVEIWAENDSLIIHSLDGGSPGEVKSIMNRGNSIRCIKGTLLPGLSTSNNPKVTMNSIETGGYVSYDAGLKIIARGVCWSTSPNPTITNDKTINGSGTGIFTCSINGLNANTVYYLRAYATNSAGTSYGNELLIKTYSGTVSDIDGNTYNVTTIGTQNWMVEELRTTKFSDGIPIPLVTDGSIWKNLTTPGYCWFNNIEGYWSGPLYNWYSINTGNLCPTGWHIPADEEWSVLSTYLGGEEIAGGKMKESGTNNWASPNTGADNSSGFTALPRGCRDYFGTYQDLNNIGSWWSSSERVNTNYAWSRSVNSSTANLSHNSYIKTWGFSVRCLKDN